MDIKQMNEKQLLKKLQNHLTTKEIMGIGINKNTEVFVETDWYVYLLKVKKDTLRVNVIWSDRKRPYLIAGIGIVLFLLFFMGGPVAEWSIVIILVTLGLVNIFKYKEISKMREDIYKALE